MIPKTQEQFLHEILDLKKANPNVEIVFCTSYDELSDEEWSWTAQTIDSVSMVPWYEYNERIYHDEEDIREKIMDELDSECSSRRDEEMEKSIDERYAERVKQKICVYLKAGYL